MQVATQDIGRGLGIAWSQKRQHSPVGTGVHRQHDVFVSIERCAAEARQIEHAHLWRVGGDDHTFIDNRLRVVDFSDAWNIFDIEDVIVEANDLPTPLQRRPEET